MPAAPGAPQPNASCTPDQPGPLRGRSMSDAGLHALAGVALWSSLALAGGGVGAVLAGWPDLGLLIAILGLAGAFGGIIWKRRTCPRCRAARAARRLPPDATTPSASDSPLPPAQ